MYVRLKGLRLIMYIVLTEHSSTVKPVLLNLGPYYQTLLMVFTAPIQFLSAPQNVLHFRFFLPLSLIQPNSELIFKLLSLL